MKFKAGDKIIPVNAPNTGMERTVVGYASNGHVVYEYDNGGVSVSNAPEDKFKRRPTKKEGWINLYRRDALLDGIDRACGGLVFPTEQAAKDYPGHGKLSTIRIEWEE